MATILDVVRSNHKKQTNKKGALYNFAYRIGIKGGLYRELTQKEVDDLVIAAVLMTKKHVNSPNNYGQYTINTACEAVKDTLLRYPLEYIEKNFRLVYKQNIIIEKIEKTNSQTPIPIKESKCILNLNLQNNVPRMRIVNNSQNRSRRNLRNKIERSFLDVQAIKEAQKHIKLAMDQLKKVDAPKNNKKRIERISKIALFEKFIFEKKWDGGLLSAEELIREFNQKHQQNVTIALFYRFLRKYKISAKNLPGIQTNHLLPIYFAEKSIDSLKNQINEKKAAKYKLVS